MKSKLILSSLLTALALISIQSDHVSGQEAGDPKPPETVRRTYDVADLVKIPSDYPLDGDFVPITQIRQNLSNTNQNGQYDLFTGRRGDFSQADQGRAERLDAVVKYILDTVDTTSWQNNGGNIGSITSSPLWGRLIVSQTPQNQKAVERAINELRGPNHMIRIRVDYVLLSPGQVEKLQKNGVDDTAALPEISRDLLRALPEGTVHYQASITAFSGQTVHIASGRAKSVVTNITPVVAPYAVAMDPSVSNIQEGIALEVSPTLCEGSAILEISSVVTEPNKAPAPPPSANPALMPLEHIDSVMQRLGTTVQVPLNKPVLVAGATSNPNQSDPAAKQLYLIIEADAAK